MNKTEKANYIFTRTITDDEIFLQKCISLDQELKDALFFSSSSGLLKLNT